MCVRVHVHARSLHSYLGSGNEHPFAMQVLFHHAHFKRDTPAELYKIRRTVHGIVSQRGGNATASGTAPTVADAAPAGVASSGMAADPSSHLAVVEGGGLVSSQPPSELEYLTEQLQSLEEAVRP